MRLAILAFALGIWLCQQQPRLPDASALWAALALAGAAAGAASWRRVRRPAVTVALGLLGFVWGCWHGQHLLAQRLAPELEGRDIQVVGVIAGLPQPFERGERFVLRVEQSEFPLPPVVQLAWYRDGKGTLTPGLRAAERWQLRLRLKRPHGNLNPHGFDYEAWLFEQGIGATGYVRAGLENVRLEALVLQPGPLLQRARQAIREQFEAALPQSAYRGILVALAIGDQRAIETDYWTVFNRTGLTHLFSVSGMHITLIAGLAGALVGWAWRRSVRLSLWLPAQKAAIAVGWMVALGYSLLAGWGIPAQRTFFMLSVAALAMWSHRSASPSRVLTLGLVAVLVADPLAVTAAGFWLSFGAVAVLFFVSSGQIGQVHWLRQAVRSQWAVTLALLPALLGMFQQFSLISPIANAVAIPVVTFLVTPLALLAAVAPFDVLMQLAHGILAALMVLVTWLAGQPLAVWQQAAPAGWAVVLATAGCLALLLPRGVPGRLAGLPMLFPLLLAAPPRPVPGEYWLTVLDVGQGLAVHVQTATHDLIYDTGPQYSQDANSGNRVILPYLRGQGVSRLDALIITHADIDHSGGAESVLEAVPTTWSASSLPAESLLRGILPAHRPCVAGQRWAWDGVDFEVLHPPAGALEGAGAKENDLSCVVRVTNHRHVVLLAADVEAAAEAQMLARDPAGVRADVLVVPHHGSRTSSTSAFVDAVDARTAVFPVGYRNRFLHPNGEVLARYQARGTAILRTDLDGAVTIRAGARLEVETTRAKRRRYWHSGRGL